MGEIIFDLWFWTPDLEQFVGIFGQNMFYLGKSQKKLA